MAKVIAEKIIEQPVSDRKYVEIKHINTLKDADGNDVDVLDFKEDLPVDEAIERAETRKANLQAQLTECEAELAEYIAIRDAE